MSRPTPVGFVLAALIVLAVAGVGLGGLRAASAPHREPQGPHGRVVLPPPAPPVPVWPAAGAPLFDVASKLPDGWAGLRVVVDAGHGAVGNMGLPI